MNIYIYYTVWVSKNAGPPRSSKIRHFLYWNHLKPMVLGIHHFKKHPCISIYLYYIELPSLIDIKVGKLKISCEEISSAASWKHLSILLGGNMFLIYHIIICIYMCVWAAVKINCWCLVRKYRLSLFGGAYRFTVFCLNQH